MPAIPESTRSSIILRLLDHAEHNWSQLAKVQARYHGSFAYITGVLPGGNPLASSSGRYARLGSGRRVAPGTAVWCIRRRACGGVVRCRERRGPPGRECGAEGLARCRCAGT